MSQIPRGPYSEQTQRQVDQEVARLLGEAEDRAVSLLKRHRSALDRLAGVLMDQETVDGSAVLNSLRAEPSTPETDGHGGFLPEVMSYPASPSDMPSSNGG
jgi:cell division protease FtsH